LMRVQCKWASRDDNVVVVRCYSARRNAEGLVRRLYSRDEIDAIAAYCADVGRCYFIPFDLVPRGGTLGLRLAGTRNNQRRRINWAEDYEFGAKLGRLGAVAQLGERAAGSR
jgi:PD-(D/E)XK endonuclease